MTLTFSLFSVGAAFLAITGLLLVMFFWMWREWDRQAVAAARHVMFRERDKLFLLFATSELGVQDRSHIAIREGINSTIRFAHWLTVPRIFLMSRALTVRSASYSWGLSDIRSAPLRDEASESVNKIHRALLWLPLSRSPIFYVLSKILGTFAALTGKNKLISYFVETISTAIYSSRPAGALLDKAERRGVAHAS